MILPNYLYKEKGNPLLIIILALPMERTVCLASEMSEQMLLESKMPV